MPVPLGFFIECLDIALRSGRSYRGIDRLPDVRAPDEPRSSLKDVLADRYYDDLDSGRLQMSRLIAAELAKKFTALGQPMEVVYAMVDYLPESLQSDASETISRGLSRKLPSRPPPDSQFLGFDVALPIRSYSSAILNCQVSEDDLSGLNEFGLFSDERASRAVADRLNRGRVQTAIPLATVMIWSVHPAQGT